MKSNTQKSFDDLVYEDEFYDKYQSDVEVHDGESQESDETGEETLEVILVCEECDHRWEETKEEMNSISYYCPLCGSDRVIEI